MATTKTRDTRSAAENATTWTDAEISAMKAHAKEIKNAQKAGDKAAEGERDVLAKIAEMPNPDREIAERIHAIVKESAPQLESRTYYGMPAYTRDGTLTYEPNLVAFSFRYEMRAADDTLSEAEVEAAVGELALEKARNPPRRSCSSWPLCQPRCFGRRPRTDATTSFARARRWLGRGSHTGVGTGDSSRRSASQPMTAS